MSNPKLQHRLLLLPCLLVLLSGATSCPYTCDCGSEILPSYAECASKSIRLIPQDLPPTIEKLDLAFNEIRAVESTISQYQSLTHLDLHRNKISVVEARCFQELHDLNFLDLSDNELGSFEYGAFVGLFQLREISLSRNNLETLPLGLFVQSPHLETVVLDGNRLTTLSVHVFDGVDSLLRLSLAKNSLTFMPPGVYDHLESLVLDENEIKPVFVSEQPQFPRLRRLSMNGCSIQKLPAGVFKHTPQLQKLELHSNSLDVFPTEALSDLGHLNELNLGLNYFSGIGSDSLRGLKNLEKLTVLGCAYDVDFELAQDAFKHSMNLKQLKIAKCPGLVSLHEHTVSRLPYLEELDLYDNNLATIPENFADWKKLLHFDVSGNPLHCDCSLAWLTEYSGENYQNSASTYCNSPKNSLGKRVESLSGKLPRCGADYENSNQDEDPVDGKGDKDDGGLALGAIIGIIIAAVIILVLAGYFLQKCWKRRKAASARPGKRKHNILRKSGGGSINKAEIKVIPTEVGEVHGFFDVVPVSQLDEQEEEKWRPLSSGSDSGNDEHIYEEMPMAAVMDKEQGPDVKISIL